MKTILLILLPICGFSQVRPVVAAAFGTNFGTGLHADVELGAEYGRLLGTFQYRQYFGAHSESTVGFKAAVAAIYTNSSNLCYLAPILGVYRDNYTGGDEKKYHPITCGVGLRVQTYNVYWELSYQQAYVGFTVGYQFKKMEL